MNKQTNNTTDSASCEAATHKGACNETACPATTEDTDATPDANGKSDVATPADQAAPSCPVDDGDSPAGNNQKVSAASYVCPVCKVIHTYGSRKLVTHSAKEEPPVQGLALCEEHDVRPTHVTLIGTTPEDDQVVDREGGTGKVMCTRDILSSHSGRCAFIAAELFSAVTGDAPPANGFTIVSDHILDQLDDFTKAMRNNAPDTPAGDKEAKPDPSNG